jgi:tetratricopeptide (TPR) repeat protein
MLTDMGDGHPFNFYRIVEQISELGVDAFLANTRDFLEWKHRQSSEYLRRLELSAEDVSILGLLRLAPELDFPAIVAALPVDPALLSDRLLGLSHNHIIETSGDRFLIAPPLRVAVEKDSRISLAKDVQARAVSTLTSSLAVRLEEGTAPLALIDAAILLALQQGSAPSEYIAAFVLPSHYVWLANVRYDGGEYKECIRLCQEALKRSNRLSSNGIVLACRFLCLAASRLGQNDVFEQGITTLEKSAHDDWAMSNVCYLNGFNLRMKGNFPKAEEAFKRARQLVPGNAAATREIAAICLARNNLEEAESYAREAHSLARAFPLGLESTLGFRHGSDM